MSELQTVDCHSSSSAGKDISKISTYDAVEALHKGDKIAPSWLIESDDERTKYNNYHCPQQFVITNESVTVTRDIILRDPSKIDIDKLITDGLSKWFIPDEYLQLDLRDYIIKKTPGHAIERVQKELDLYEEMDLFNVLKFLIYLVDSMRKNNQVWGVGRGSSVSSYVLFIIGVHRIDPLKYNLAIEEFLR